MVFTSKKYLMLSKFSYFDNKFPVNRKNTQIKLQRYMYEYQFNNFITMQNYIHKLHV